jgi:hypothetical protein
MFVQLLRLPDAGVPSTGVVKVGDDKVADARVGDVANTTEPVPVAVVAPVPPLAMASVPVTELRLTFVQFDRLPDTGVPSAGLVSKGAASCADTSAGPEDNTTDPVPVLVALKKACAPIAGSALVPINAN